MVDVDGKISKSNEEDIKHPALSHRRYQKPRSNSWPMLYQCSSEDNAMDFIRVQQHTSQNLSPLTKQEQWRIQVNQIMKRKYMTRQKSSKIIEIREVRSSESKSVGERNPR